MNNFKWAILGDPHWGVKGDSKIFHTVFEIFYTDLLNYLTVNGIKTLIILGDIFERRKFINFDTLMECKRVLFNRLRDLNIKVYTIAGNHDVYYKNTNRVNSLELVLPESEFPNITHTVHEAREITIDNQKVIFVPWVNRENYDTIRKQIEKSDAQYMIAHLDMAGFEMHKGSFSERGHFEAEFLDKFKMVITGHYHTKSFKGNIFYTGTPYQTSWSDYGEVKGFHVLDETGMQMIPNRNETFYRFVYTDEAFDELHQEIKETSLKDKYVKLVIRSKQNPKNFERFVAAVEEWQPADLNILDETNFVNEGEALTEDDIKDTLGVIRGYIENELETDLDKTRLFNNVANLYHMAVDMTDGD